MKILNENAISGASDIATGDSFDALITKFEIEKEDFDSFIGDIANFSIVKSPVTKIFNKLSIYNDSNKVNYDNSIIVEFDVEPTNYVVGNSYTIDSKSVEVVVIEDKTVLLKVSTTDRFIFVKDGIGMVDVTNTYTITAVNTNITKLDTMFSEYTGPYTTEEGESYSTTKSVDLVFKATSAELGTRKIKSSLTTEFVDDLNSYIKLDAKEVVFNELSDVINREIEIELLNKIKARSTKFSLLDLSSSYGVDDSLEEISSDIYAAIRVMANNVASNLKSRKDIFVTVSTDVASLLMTNILFTADTDEDDFYIGQIGVYPVYLDPYSRDEYISVGYNKQNSMEGGVNVSIYNEVYIQEAIDQDTGDNIYWVYVRYFIEFNPADVEADDSSIYYSSCPVDVTGLVNFPIQKA